MTVARPLTPIFISAMNAQVMHIMLPPMIHGCYIAALGRALRDLPFVSDYDWTGYLNASTITLKGTDLHKHRRKVLRAAEMFWAMNQLSRFILQEN